MVVELQTTQLLITAIDPTAHWPTHQLLFNEVSETYN